MGERRKYTDPFNIDGKWYCHTWTKSDLGPFNTEEKVRQAYNDLVQNERTNMTIHEYILHYGDQ